MGASKESGSGGCVNTPGAWTTATQGGSVDIAIVAPPSARVKCFRCEGDDCPKCGGTGYCERKRCAECGEPSGRISEGLRPLVGLKDSRDRNGAFYHVGCHPERGRGNPAALDLIGG